jgi:hypothetical protein
MIQQSYDWIVNCIYSSTNTFHLDCCKTLIELFKKQFINDERLEKFYSDLANDLYVMEGQIVITV